MRCSATWRLVLLHVVHIRGSARGARAPARADHIPGCALPRRLYLEWGALAAGAPPCANRRFGAMGLVAKPRCPAPFRARIMTLAPWRPCLWLPIGAIVVPGLPTGFSVSASKERVRRGKRAKVIQHRKTGYSIQLACLKMAAKVDLAALSATGRSTDSPALKWEPELIELFFDVVAILASPPLRHRSRNRFSHHFGG